MDRFFAPAVWLVNRLSYPWKFAVLSVLFVIMLAPPFWGLIGYVKFNVDFSAKERVGVEYMAPLKTLLLDVARHQRQVELARGGNAEAMGQLSGLQKRLDDELAEMDDLNTRLDPQLATDKDWQALKKSWLSLKAESLAIPPAQSAKRHDEVLDLGNALITTIGKTSNLVLDPDVDSYYLMDSVLYRFIPLVQTADQLRVLGANLATKKSITLREQIELVTLETRLRGLLDLTEGNFGETTGYNDSLKPTLEPKFQLYHESVENLLTIVHNGLTTKYDNQAAITVSPALIHQRTMALVDATEAAYDVHAPMLDDLIGIRIENVFLKPFYGTLIATAIVILLIAYFFYGFYLSVAGTVSSLEDGAQRIGKGDLTTRLQIDTRDELSRVAHSFNDIAETFQRLIGEIRNGALHVASSSEELSATSSQMKAGAHGLTNMAANTLELAAGVKGSLKTVATAVEHSTSSIRQVHNASGLVEENIHSVESAAKSVADNMQTVAAAAEEMSASVNTVASAIEEMSASLGEVARSATQGASVANVAEQRASQTKDTIDTLGKSAREIEQVLEVIKEIAAQTNLLALNATIEAASAGEAGKGFAVVANEVKALARRSAEATEDIRSRIQGIQTNMGAAVHAIGDISSVITEMNQINNTIASAVEEQNATVDEITRSVSQVALSAQEVSKNVHNAAGRAGEVTVQVAKATENMRQINRNMDELSNGAVEIRQAVDRSENDALSMVDNMGQVNTASKETETGVANIELTATQLASLATELESIIGQFKVG